MCNSDNKYLTPISTMDHARQQTKFYQLSDRALAEQLATAALSFGNVEVQNLLSEAARRLNERPT